MSLHLNLSVVYPHYSRNNISYTADLINGHQNTTADVTEAMRDMVLIRPNCNAHRISLYFIMSLLICCRDLHIPNTVL